MDALTIARLLVHARIDMRAERAKAEIKLMASIAKRQIARKHEFEARSTGQIRRAGTAKKYLQRTMISLQDSP